MLSLYQRAIALRPQGSFAWRESPPGVLAFDRDDMTCVVNFGPGSVPLPHGEVVLASADDVAGGVPPNTAAWIK